MDNQFLANEEEQTMATELLETLLNTPTSSCLRILDHAVAVVKRQVRKEEKLLHESLKFTEL